MDSQWRTTTLPRLLPLLASSQCYSTSCCSLCDFYISSPRFLTIALPVCSLLSLTSLPPYHLIAVFDVHKIILAYLMTCSYFAFSLSLDHFTEIHKDARPRDAGRLSHDSSWELCVCQVPFPPDKFTLPVLHPLYSVCVHNIAAEFISLVHNSIRELVITRPLSDPSSRSSYLLLRLLTTAIRIFTSSKSSLLIPITIPVCICLSGFNFS